MEPIDVASVVELHLREVALLNHKTKARVDVPARVCAGCDEKVHGTTCPEYRLCLQDYERRERMAKINGRRDG